MSTPLLPLLKRKTITARAIVHNCSNWCPVLLSRLLPGSFQGAVRLKSGVVIHPKRTLTGSWGEIFEAAIADVYGILTIPSPDVIWDIGANIGAFSCLAGHAHPNALISAYEPDPDTVAVFQKNVRANALDNVTIIPCPVTKDGRMVDFSMIGGGGSSNIFSTGKSPTTKMQSTSLNLNGFRADQHLFIKLDCEGAEGEIIEWICEQKQGLPPDIHLVAEYHHWCPITPQQSLRHLHDAGFSADMKIHFGELYLSATRHAR